MVADLSKYLSTENKPFYLLAISALLLSAMLFSSCSVDIYPKMLSSDRPSGEMTFVYTHRNHEVPRLHWENAMKQAEERCLEWGYSGVRKYEAGEIDCLSQSESGCTRFQVKHRVYCYD